MLKKSLITVLSLPILFTSFAQPAFAMSVPEFGSCLNPQVAASQVNTGNNHGVIGKSGNYSGTDTIYSLSNGNVMQCLCPDSGNGVQTNWLKASSFSQSDIDVLKNQGWIYVATGSSWGLEDVPYLAKNSDYACKAITPTCTPTPSVTQTPTPTPTGTLTPTPTTTPGPTATPTPTPVQGSVLSLASTGNIIIVYGLIIAGAVSLIAGMILKRFSK